MMPLEGIKVLDFSNLLPGPFCTMILAELGAEVVKVERPNGGDITRSTPLRFEATSRSKKSLALDLKDPSVVEQLKELIHQFDIVVEGFRPGVMDRLGLSYKELFKWNEKIVYCSISGFGQTGPMSKVPGHDINYLATAGLLSISGDPSGPPAAWGGVQVADLASGMYAVIAILAAIKNREKTGIGEYLDVSMTDSVLAWMGPRIGQYFDKNKPTKEKFMGRGAYGAFETKDGKYVAIGAMENHFYKGLCKAINREDLIEMEMFKSWSLRCENARELNEIIQDELWKKTYDDWLILFDKYDVPYSKVNTINDLVKEELFISRDVIKTFGSADKGEYYIKFPVKFSNSKLNELKPAPKLGEQNAAFLKKFTN